MEIRYWLIPSKVTKFTSSTGSLSFRESSDNNMPVHVVDWNDNIMVSKKYTTYQDGTALPANPKVGDALLLALSDKYCDAQGISKVGRTKKPVDLGADDPLTGDWYGLRLKDVVSLVLELKNGKKLDLSNRPLAMLESLHVDADGQLAVLLSNSGKSKIGSSGLMRFDGSLNEFLGRKNAEPSAPSATTASDRQKLKALLLSLAAVLD